MHKPQHDNSLKLKHIAQDIGKLSNWDWSNLSVCRRIELWKLLDSINTFCHLVTGIIAKFFRDRSIELVHPPNLDFCFGANNYWIAHCFLNSSAFTSSQGRPSVGSASYLASRSSSIRRYSSESSISLG